MKNENQRKMLNPFALIFFIIIGCGLLSFIIPSGSYDMMEVGGRQVVDPNSFHYTDIPNLSFIDFFLAIPAGLIKASMLVLNALILGGAIEVMQETGALKTGISRAVIRFGDKSGNVLLIILLLIFGFLGGFLGFIEGALPFIPLAVVVAVGLGYDSLVGVGLAVVGSIFGFATGPTNPFTVGISHTLAELPLYSGIGFRLVIMAVLLIISGHYILSYAKKIKQNPSLSLMADVNTEGIKFDVSEYQDKKFTAGHILVVLSLVTVLVIFVLGVVVFKWGWYFNELGALFLMAAVFSGIVCKLGINRTAESFIRGVKNFAPGAFIIGLAYGIPIILEQSGIIHTVIHAISGPLASLPKSIGAIAMLIAHCIINFFIPSGSGQAAATMPIMLPLSDIVGISRQTAVLAFQFGDGITNVLYPTVGALLMALAFGKVPYNKWVKFVFPLVLRVLVVAIICLVGAVIFNYGPF